MSGGPIIEIGYEVKLPVFEGPLDLLLYLVQKNELDPRTIAIADITDQYLIHLDQVGVDNLSNAGEFLVMAARLMRLKARELLPSDQKDELEELEYELDRQSLIKQMLEYQVFKEAARTLRNFESRHFGAFPRGIPDKPEDGPTEIEVDAGVFDLLAAFREVVGRRPRTPVHEVEIDDVTIEDRIQEVDAQLAVNGRCLFEDLFESDPRRIVKVVTFMALLELCKLDRVSVRQHRALGAIWVYRRAAPAYEEELSVPEESDLDPLPKFETHLVDWVKERASRQTMQSAVEEMLGELEREMRGESAATSEEADGESLRDDGDSIPSASCEMAEASNTSLAEGAESNSLEAGEALAADPLGEISDSPESDLKGESAVSVPSGDEVMSSAPTETEKSGSDTPEVAFGPEEKAFLEKLAAASLDKGGPEEMAAGLEDEDST
jgi:chromatin segregation and condensation protein Rec8/ScpA/Scc1 (kleisin family)